MTGIYDLWHWIVMLTLACRYFILYNLKVPWDTYASMASRLNLYLINLKVIINVRVNHFGPGLEEYHCHLTTQLYMRSYMRYICMSNIISLISTSSKGYGPCYRWTQNNKPINKQTVRAKTQYAPNHRSRGHNNMVWNAWFQKWF